MTGCERLRLAAGWLRRCGRRSFPRRDVIAHGLVTTDGPDVRWLGCRSPGARPICLHDVVSHRVPGVFDRAGELSRGARGALAVDRPRGLHQPVQLLAEDLRGRLRHGRGVGHRDVLPVRHQLVGILRQDRPRDRPADGLRGADRVLPRGGISRRHAVRTGAGRPQAAFLRNRDGRRRARWFRRSGSCPPIPGCRRRQAMRSTPTGNSSPPTGSR